MNARRLIQSVLLLGFCLFVLSTLRALYLVGVALAAGVAISSGLLVVWSLAVALVWPVLVLAFVAHRLSDGARSSSTASESPRDPFSDR